jgi:hypothetical protein
MVLATSRIRYLCGLIRMNPPYLRVAGVHLRARWNVCAESGQPMMAGRTSLLMRPDPLDGRALTRMTQS